MSQDYHNTAKQAWKGLKALFADKNRAKSKNLGQQQKIIWVKSKVFGQRQGIICADKFFWAPKRITYAGLSSQTAEDLFQSSLEFWDRNL